MELSVTQEGACLVVTVLAAEVDHTVSEEFKDAVLMRYEVAKARAALAQELERVKQVPDSVLVEQAAKIVARFCEF